MIKSFTKYILTLVAILMVTSNAWAATATLGAKKQNVTADGITFSLGGSYTINNILVDYSYTASGKEATLSWTVPTGYTISVSQITINAKNDKSWGTTGKGQYKTSKNGTYTQFCNSNSWSTYTLSSSSYFPLGNGGSITLKAVDKELQWKDIVFTYTKTAHKYNIAFDANGGTGETEDISNISYDAPVNLTPNGFTYNKFIVTYDANGGSCSTTEEIGNYKFAGWAETSNGAVKYTNGQSVKNLTSTDGATVTLYAKWNEPDNATITLPTATKTGAVLEGWYLGDTKIGEAGDTYTPTSSVTLTAKWIEKYTPEIKGSDATILVGEEIPNAFTFKNTSNPTAIITKKSISDIRNGEDVITYNAAENKIIAHNAGVAEIYFVQEPTTTIEGGTSATYTITVNKKNTSFELNFANEYYVDDEINKSTFFTNSNNNEVAISVSDSQGFFTYSDNTLKANGNTMPSGESHTTTITVTQAENYKWTKHTLTKQITLKRHTISAKINQTTAVWNELINNPFSASSTHPVSGQVTKIDNFKVEQQGNEHIALMDTNTRDIQTYYTSGSANFQVTRPEDRKYNALNQTLTLNVDQSEETCLVLEDNAERSWNTINNSGTYTIPSGTPDSLFFQAKRTAIVGISNISNFYAEYSTDNSTWQQAMTISLSNTGTWYDLKCDIPETAKYVRFVTSMGATGGKQIQNVRVTRAQYIRPTEGERALSSTDTLKLPTVAIGQPSSQQFNLKWSACSDIKIVCDNPKFTIGTPDIFSANGEQEISVDCNTSEVGTIIGNITIYNQEQMETFPISCEVYTKWLTDSISGSATYSMKVDTTWDTDFYFPIQRASEYPTTDGHFHYAIEHTFVDADQADRNPNHPDEVISYNNGVITAHNAGTAILTIKHEETAEHYASQQFTCTLTVSKRTPVFTWNDPVYFNQTTISDYFITNNTDTDIKIDSQSDTDVAKLYFNPNDDSDKHTLDLTTYYKETTPASSTTVTVSQAENWYWYAKEDTHTITPQNRNNHLSNTPITNANLDDFKLEYVDPWNKPWTSDGIHFGQGGIGSGDGGYNWNDKYIIIEFTGVPDSLYFTTETTGSATMDNPLTGDDNATNNKFFYVSAGTSKDNLEEIWSSTSKENNYKDKLDPSVRFLKLCYTGNLEGWFKNVRITELNEFEAKVEGQDETTIDTLDFGVVHITDKTEKTMVFNFKYANAGYKVSLDLDQTGGWAEEEAYQEAKKYIKITPSLIDTIGGEKYGEVKNIQVTFHSDDQSTYTIPEDARLKIADEAGHITYVYLKGEIVCTEDQIDWNAYFSLQEPIQIPISTDSIYNAANTDKYSKLPLKYRSASNGSIIKVSPNGKCFIPAGIGQDTIYAYHDGNNKVCPVESMKIVEVTEKSIQLIDWRDDLSDIIFGSDDNITLTAKVYIIDVVNNTFEYSPEQTAQLVYTVADEGESVVSIEEGTTTLKVNGLGETHLTVTIAPNDSLEGATMTIPVVVREPAIGCEDELLLDQTAPVEIFTEGINTNQVVKPAIPIDRSKGVPGYLKFEHKGEYWKLTGLINYYAGNIKAQQSTDGGTTWTDVPGSEIKPTVGTYNPTSLLPIDRNATHIRFVRPNGGQGYHYYRNVQVYPAQYIETSTNSLNFEKINMGGTYSKTITISYSNIKSPIINSTSSKDITITPAHFGECSGFGTQEVTITWNPNTKENQYIIFEDTLIDLSVRVDLIAEIDGRKQAIVWNNRTEAIYEYTDIDNRPTHTIDYNNQQPLDHPITYEVTAGNAAFENGIFFIKGTGEITIHAYHDGNDAYQRVDSFYQFNVPEMPPTFLGTAGDSLWTTQDNWANNYVPEETQTAVILAPLVIRDHKIINQLLVSDEGSVHITSTGGLTVGEGGIQCSKTDGSAIVIDNLYSGAGFLRVDPNYEGTMPRITMRYQTRSTLDNGANKDAEWQYIGAPGLNSTIYVDYNTWLYKLDEPNNNWVLQPRVDSVSLDPFEGYAITQYGKPIYEWTADMTTEDCTIPLTYSKNGRGGRHIIANSYTAPINVAAFTGDEFQFLEGMSTKYRIEQTLYIFNSGSWNNWNTAGQTATGSSAGQYYAIPVKAAAAQYMTEDIGEQTTIAPMQGIYLRVRSLTPLDELPEAGEQVGNLVLDYAQLVMGSGHEMHRPMRAPQRTTSSAMQDPNFRRVRIVATSENSGADRVYIIQDNINTRKYNNGYDATNQEAKGLVNIYTNETGGKMEVSCSNNIDSMYIGFMAGSDHTYTLHFSAIIGDILYLQDLDNGQKISIVEGGSYTFEAEPQSTNHKRFLLLTSQGVSTGTDEVALANIWYSNKALHITNAPNNSTLTLYDISGHQLLSTTIQETPYTLDLSHLTEGIYIARLNNQVYKFVCK